MTDVQTINDAVAIVRVSCARVMGLRAWQLAKTAFTSLGGPGGCQVLAHPTPARIRMGRKTSVFALAPLPRSP